ncbi:hypothetical protein C9I92_01330 [Photobacterium ganghwense]|nr:hypothetical protein C9I92_01330 [Photobacterium ganghwense]
MVHSGSDHSRFRPTCRPWRTQFGLQHRLGRVIVMIYSFVMVMSLLMVVLYVTKLTVLRAEQSVQLAMSMAQPLGAERSAYVRAKAPGKAGGVDHPVMPVDTDVFAKTETPSKTGMPYMTDDRLKEEAFTLKHAEALVEQLFKHDDNITRLVVTLSGDNKVNSVEVIGTRLAHRQSEEAICSSGLCTSEIAVSALEATELEASELGESQLCSSVCCPSVKGYPLWTLNITGSLGDPPQKSMVYQVDYCIAVMWFSAFSKALPLLVIYLMSLSAAFVILYRWLHRQSQESRRLLETGLAMTEQLTEELRDCRQPAPSTFDSSVSSQLKQYPDIWANVSHELCTPLNGILGFVQCLEHEHALSDKPLYKGGDKGRNKGIDKEASDVAKAKSHKDEILPAAKEAEIAAPTPASTVETVSPMLEQTAFIKQAALTLNHSIEGLLDYLRLEQGDVVTEMQCVRVSQLVRQCVDNITARATEKRLRLDVRLPSDANLPVMLDTQHLQKIIGCLLDNAVKFTDDGEIRVSVTLTPQAAVLLQNGEPEGDRSVSERVPLSYVDIDIRIQDSGGGIPVNRLQAVFRPFIQADAAVAEHYGGLGLGLTIASRLAKLMGARLRLNSSKGKGVECCLTLTANQATQGTLPVEEAFRTCDLSRFKACSVLVADDSKVNQLLVKALLVSMGMSRIRFADDGRQAVAAVKADQPDVVLMDCQMPQMNGIEATAAIRRYYGSNQLPVVALTANVSETERQRCLNAGMNDFVTKPVFKTELFQALWTVLEAKQPK